MERSGLMKCLDFLENEGILNNVIAFISDRDCKVSKIFKEQHRLKGIYFGNDPGTKRFPPASSSRLIKLGHIKKGLQNDLVEVFGTSVRYISYPSRMAQWYLKALKEAERQVDMMTLEQIDNMLSFESKNPDHTIMIEDGASLPSNLWSVKKQADPLPKFSKKKNCLLGHAFNL